MIRYIPIASSVAANALNGGLWDLSVPSQDREGNATQHLFTVVRARNSSFWLQIDSEYEITVGAFADGQAVNQILSARVSSGDMTQGELDSIIQSISNARGGPLNPWVLIPAFLKVEGKSEDEMVTLGLLHGHGTGL